MNVNDARALANKHGRSELIEKAIKSVEKKIIKKCEEGGNHICYGIKEEFGGESFYIDGEYHKLPEVRQHFINQGFNFKNTGYVSGVYQHTEDLYW